VKPDSLNNETKEKMKAIIIDTETTGFNDPEPIEIAYTVYSDLNLVSIKTFHKYYKPSKPIELGAMATHHIMDEDLVNREKFSTLKYPLATEYLIGHNVDFDWEVIGKPPLKRICTLALSRELFPDTKHSLSAMMYLLERETARAKLKTAHSAVADIGFCAEILRHMIPMLKVNTWEELWEASEKARIPKVMPFGKHKGDPLGKVPKSYLGWLSRQTDVDPYLMKAIKKLI